MIPDNKRPPLSYREYRALRQLFGIVEMWNKQGSELKKRLNLIPGGWRDARLLMAVSERLLRKVLETIPTKKLAMIQKELNSTTCEIVVKNTILPDKKEAFTYVEEETLERVTDLAMQFDCLFCEKRGRDARSCQLRKDIERLYMWDFPKVKDGHYCHFAECVIGDFKDETI